MNRRTYGVIAGLIAAGLGTWWWRSRRMATAPRFDGARGTVIFDNTPQASTPDGNV